MNKKQKKKIKELAHLAWQREIDKELNSLSKGFEKWKNKEIDSADLVELIHKFHNGSARQIWVKYNNSNLEEILIFAVASDILKKEEIPENIYNTIKEKIGIITKQSS